MQPLFDVPPAPTVPVVGADGAFPVRRIFCVGRNYAAHAREMGFDPEREPPFFFTKFAETIVANDTVIPYPPETSDLQYEAELVVAIAGFGRNVPVNEARDLIFGYAVGLDMTRRDLQLLARDKGRPWDMGKNFAFSAPIAPMRRVEDGGHVVSGPIELRVNTVVKQQADIRDMIWSCDEIVAHLSRYEPLAPGDLIYTGTPAGVGPVMPGDTIEVSIATLPSLRVTVGQPYVAPA